MKVLVIEKSADGALDIAIRAWREGHAVRYALASYDQAKCPVGRGLVERESDWRDSVSWADLIVLGSNDLPMAEIERRCRLRGVPWIGGTAESAKWENDRLYGMDIFHRAKIQTPPTREFTDYDSAILFVEKRGEPMFCKPCWPDADKALSCKSGIDDDPAFMLKKFKRQFGRPKGTFILQEAIKGVEMGVGAWFGPDGFAPGWEENFEFKRFFPGDLGPNTGEMASVLRYVARSKLADKVLKPVEDTLHRSGFIGSVDVNTIIDEDGAVWPLEWTMRCGWPALNIEQELIEGDFVEFLAGLAEGSPPKNAHRMDEIAVGIVWVIPPFPFPITDYSAVVGWPIRGITPAMEDHVHLANAQAIDGELATAGDYIAIGTGTGKTVKEASDQANRIVRRLKVPASPYWRKDAGARLRSELPAIQQHGFAADLSYS